MYVWTFWWRDQSYSKNKPLWHHFKFAFLELKKKVHSNFLLRLEFLNKFPYQLFCMSFTMENTCFWFLRNNIEFYIKTICVCFSTSNNGIYWTARLKKFNNLIRQYIYLHLYISNYKIYENRKVPIQILSYLMGYI